MGPRNSAVYRFLERGSIYFSGHYLVFFRGASNGTGSRGDVLEERLDSRVR